MYTPPTGLESPSYKQLCHDMLLICAGFIMETGNPDLAVETLLAMAKQLETEGAKPKPYLLDACKL